MNTHVGVRILISALIALSTTSSLAAFSFQPISQTFSPSGRDATRSFRMENDSGEYLAVQLKALTREINAEGQETNEEAGEVFTIYPSKVVMKPNSSQTVKVQYKGPEDLESERCYRILVEQLPVNFGDESTGGGNLRILFKYLASIYIRPADVEAEVVIASAKAEQNEEGNLTAVLLFENRGRQHSILTDLELTLTDESGARLDLSGKKLSGIKGENLLPGGTRRFTHPLPENFSEGDIDVEFSYDDTP